MTSADIEVTRTETGEVLIDISPMQNNLLMAIAHLYVNRREEMHDMFADLVALEAVESRGMHAQENSVQAILSNLYGTTNNNPYVPLTHDDIKRLRRALEDPDKPKARPAFSQPPAAMAKVAAISTLADQANASERTGETPIFEELQNGKDHNGS